MLNMPQSPDSVVLIDAHYVAPNKAAVYLILENGRAAFIDNNTSHALPHLMGALQRVGLTPEDVEYAIITHVHLDHAGGTASLLKACPNATVLAHPRAARHIVEPARLVAGAKAVYGEEVFQRLYGDIEGVPADRVRVMQDGEELDWGNRRLRFFYTLGHASHHFCVYDSGSNGVFSGDAFGLGLTDLVRPGPPFLICSTSPPDFDAEEAYRSVRMIEETGADWAFLPHFGSYPDLKQGAAQMIHALGLMENILNEAVFGEVREEELDAFCLMRAGTATRTHLEWCKVSDISFDLAWLGEDIRLNAMGLAYAARRMRNKRGFE